MVDIGLEYLTLNRTSATLSGGEAQRIRLATQIGSGLTGVLYVCDEPSVGLHPADDDKLIGTLEKLKNLGNTVLVVEHDETIMRSADHIIDLGPGAGEHGGRIIAEGNQNIKDLYREFNLNLPSSESSTIAGYVMDLAKKIPLYGEIIKDEYFHYKIISHSRKQIHRLEISKI